MSKVLMCDVPSGYLYGFPRALPKEATIHYGGTDYGVVKDFNVAEWIVANGYPQKEIDSFGDQFCYRYWTEDE